MKRHVNSIKEIIKDEIRKKYGHKIRYAKDCQILSDSILKTTGRQVSVSTLKRFFGIILTPFNPSKYTLDTLAIYLNFKNWEDYANSFEESKHSFSTLNTWEQLNKRAQYITGGSLEAIEAKIGSETSNLPLRDFAERKINGFLHSPKVATAFIAPGGYGKSTLIYQLIEHFFDSEEAKFPNDIVMLLDGGSLISLINRFEEIRWMHNLLEFKAQNSFSNYFRNNPDEVKGRFVLIIDALNEIFYQTEKLTGFLENLLDIVASYESIPWFKLIITCQPDNWKILTSIAQRKPFVKKLWFDVSFNAIPSETINVPLLSKKEINEILELKHSKQLYQQLRFHSPETAEMIAQPYFLNLFLRKKREGGCTDVDLLNDFISDNLLAEPYPVEKAKIIDAMLQHLELGKKMEPINKEELPCSEECAVAYKDLIARNILYELTIPGSYFSMTTAVRFSHDILMEFMLANKWLRENKFDLDLIRKVINYYGESKLLRCNVIKYMIKIAFKERKTELLKDIYTIFSKGSSHQILANDSDASPETLNIINVELRKHKEMRDYLIPHYANTESGQLFYFESFFDMDSLALHAGDNVDYYLKNNPAEDAQIYGHFLKFTQYFLTQNQNRLQNEYEWFQEVKHPERLNPLAAGFYYAILITKTSAIDNATWKKILDQAEHYLSTAAQISYNFPIFEHLIINALNYAGCFSKTIELFKLVTEKYVFSSHKSNWLYQLMTSFYARALLKTGSADLGLEIFNQIEIKSVSINYNYYVKLRYYIFKIEFLLYQKRFDDANQQIQDVKSIARMIRFKYFYDQAVALEENLKASDPKKTPANGKKNLNAL